MLTTPKQQLACRDYEPGVMCCVRFILPCDVYYEMRRKPSSKRGKMLMMFRTVKYCNIRFWRDPGSWRSQCSVLRVKLRREEGEGRTSAHPTTGCREGWDHWIRPVSSHH